MTSTSSPPVKFTKLSYSDVLHRSTIDTLKQLVRDAPTQKEKTKPNDYSAIRDIIDPLWGSLEKFSRLLFQENTKILDKNAIFNGLGGLKQMLKAMGNATNLTDKQRQESSSFATDPDKQYQRIVSARNSCAHGDSTPKIVSLDNAIEFAGWLLKVCVDETQEQSQNQGKAVTAAAETSNASASSYSAMNRQQQQQKNAQSSDSKQKPPTSSSSPSASSKSNGNGKPKLFSSSPVNANQSQNQSQSVSECTFLLTGNYASPQPYYNCLTCSPTGNYHLCNNCYQSGCCLPNGHKGHQMSEWKVGNVFCDCGENEHKGKVAPILPSTNSSGCTYRVTGTKETYQKHFWCLTCEFSICEVCYASCHKGHQLYGMEGIMYCACGENQHKVKGIVTATSTLSPSSPTGKKNVKSSSSPEYVLISSFDNELILRSTKSGFMFVDSESWRSDKKQIFKHIFQVISLPSPTEPLLLANHEGESICFASETQSNRSFPVRVKYLPMSRNNEFGVEYRAFELFVPELGVLGVEDNEENNAKFRFYPFSGARTAAFRFVDIVE